MVIKIRYRLVALAVALAVLAIICPLRLYPRGRPASAGARRVCVPILLYHEVKPFKNGGIVIGPYELENDLSYLKASGYATVTMDDLIAFVDGGRALPEKPVVLSFDDGYLNNYVYALPLLKKYRMRAVLSLIARDTDNFTAHPSDNLDYAHVTWAQTLEMQNSGVFEIQNHTYDLHTIGSGRYGCAREAGETLPHYEQVLSGDLSRCQREIRAHLGVTPTTFTYPYGRVSDESLPVVRRMGFRASLSCRYGVNLIDRSPDSLYCLRRISRLHGSSLKKILRDAMETLRFRDDL